VPSRLLEFSQLPTPATKAKLPTSPILPFHPQTHLGCPSPTKLYVDSNCTFPPSQLNILDIHSSSCHTSPGVSQHAFSGRSSQSSASETHLNIQILTLPPFRVPSTDALVGQAHHTDAILVKSAAGRSVVMVDSGAGLQAVMEVEPGTDAQTAVNATSRSRVERTATILRSADAVARIIKPGKPWVRHVLDT